MAEKNPRGQRLRFTVPLFCVNKGWLVELVTLCIPPHPRYYYPVAQGRELEFTQGESTWPNLREHLVAKLRFRSGSASVCPHQAEGSAWGFAGDTPFGGLLRAGIQDSGLPPPESSISTSI